MIQVFIAAIVLSTSLLSMEELSEPDSRSLKNVAFVKANGKMHDDPIRGFWMPKADFKEINFDKIDFSHAHLQRADFSQSRLRLSKFCKTFVPEGNFYRADLSFSDLHNSLFAKGYFYRANLQNVIMTKSDFSWSSLGSANFKLAQGHVACFDHASLRWTTFDQASFIGASFKNADLSWASLRHMDLTRADLSCADLTGVRIKGTNFSGAKLVGAFHFEGGKRKLVTLDWLKAKHAWWNSNLEPIMRE